MTFSIKWLARALEQIIATLERPVEGYCVAFSGGLDSTVLLDAMAGWSREQVAGGVRAVHVDHGLLPVASDWATRCAQFSAARGIPCDIVHIDARAARGASPEAAARAARYAALAAALRPREALLTAHHADDQLETSLLQLLRGGGLRGLSAMPSATAFAGGWHLRPLLDITRQELAAWALDRGLEWVDDPSNADRRYDRNYLRHEVLPHIRERWPAAARTVSRVAGYAAEAVELELQVAQGDLAIVADGHTLSVRRLGELSRSRQHAVVRHWLRQAGFPAPASNTLEALLHDSRRAAADRIPATDWAGVSVYRYRGRLYAVRDAAPVADGTECRAGDRLDLGSGQSLEWLPAVGRGLSRSRLPEVVHVLRNTTGASFRPAGSAHERPLRKWLQEHAIVPWQRRAIPLVSAGGRLVAVGDLACAHDFAAVDDEESWVLHWSGRPPITEAEFVAGDGSGGGRGT